MASYIQNKEANAMQQPTLVELRTARAIIRQRYELLLATDPNHVDLPYCRMVVDYFTEQIKKLEFEQNYIISGNDAVGYTVTANKLFTYIACPCCDKPLDTKLKAEILAKNLYRLDQKTDALI